MRREEHFSRFDYPVANPPPILFGLSQDRIPSTGLQIAVLWSEDRASPYYTQDAARSNNRLSGEIMIRQTRRLLTFDAFGTLFLPKEPIAKQYGDAARRCGVAGLTDDAVGASFRKGRDL